MNKYKMELRSLYVLFIYNLCMVSCLPCKLKAGDPGVVAKPRTANRKVISFQCDKGWEYKRVSNCPKCVPRCNSGCIGGTCVAPNNCSCEHPLVLQKLRNGDTCVEPRCDSACFNAECVGINQCACINDFKQYNTTHCAPTCPLGFANDPFTLQCTPQCTTPCINGTCIAPDTCECLDGYTSKNKTTCVPHCQDCANGDCIEPNECRCHENYIKREGKCSPVCSRPCQNGFCSEPDVCTCNSRYILDTNDRFNCLPICDPQCVNATCLEPNKCLCLPGYESITPSACKPKCNSCDHGDCVGPDDCSCHEGYTKTNGRCEPVCTKPCVNGFCSAPDLCSCEIGYKMFTDDKFLCEPFCRHKCINGTCVSPDKCACLDGYEPTDSFVCKPSCRSCRHGDCVAPEDCRCYKGYNLVNGTCSPICLESCVNGYCNAPGICSCFDGFVRDPSYPSVCVRACVDGCEHGTCREGLCSCDEQFQNVNGTCEPIATDCVDCKNNITDILAPQEITTRLAGIELNWVMGGCVVILLSSCIISVIIYIWRKRRDYGTKKAAADNTYGSVIYTVPNTLLDENKYYGENGSDLYKDVKEEDDYDEDEDIRKQETKSLAKEWHEDERV